MLAKYRDQVREGSFYGVVPPGGGGGGALPQEMSGAAVDLRPLPLIRANFW